MGLFITTSNKDINNASINEHLQSNIASKYTIKKTSCAQMCQQNKASIRAVDEISFMAYNITEKMEIHMQKPI